MAAHGLTPWAVSLRPSSSILGSPWVKRPPSKRDIEDAYLLDVMIDVHAARATYGVRRVHAELVLGRSHHVGRRRVARLMGCHGLAGVHRRRWRHHQRAEATWPDHVQRRFVADGPDRLWVTDITQHRTSEGWVYCAAVLDVFSRRVVGWSIADHLRTELVVDALEMARLRRKPVGTILHSDRGTQYTSWLFGHRLREGSMGKVACAYDNALMESFWGSMQIELLDRRYWTTRAELANAMFEWIEALLQPRPTPLRPGLPNAGRVRTPSKDRQPRGMITTPKPSGEPVTGQHQVNQRRSWKAYSRWVCPE